MGTGIKNLTAPQAIDSSADDPEDLLTRLLAGKSMVTSRLKRDLSGSRNGRFFRALFGLPDGDLTPRVGALADHPAFAGLTDAQRKVLSGLPLDAIKTIATAYQPAKEVPPASPEPEDPPEALAPPPGASRRRHRRG